MKTFLILSTIFLCLFWAVVQAQIDDTEERERFFQESKCRHEIWKLKREIRMGPKPYVMLHPKLSHTKEQEDSVLLYFSHMTRSELFEVKGAFTENAALSGFVDTIIVFKDSVDRATKGYVGGIDE